MRDTTSQKQLVPTVQHLKDLLIALERKIACSGFLDHLLGWNMILKSEQLGLLPLFTEGEGASGEPGLLDRGRIQGFGPDGTPADVVAVHEQDLGEAMPSSELVDSFSLSRFDLSDLFSGLWRKAEPADLASREHDRLSRMTAVCQQYPPLSGISKLLQAMSELNRIGEVGFVIIRTPPYSAVWTIAFVRWCLGIEPYIRSAAAGRLMLKQAKSSVLVEIGYPASSTDFSVQTFSAVDGIQKLLWEARSTAGFTALSPWSGMVRIKTFFNACLRNLRSDYKLRHVEDCLLFFSSVFTDRILAGKSSYTSPFPSSTKVTKLLARYFDIPDPFGRLERLRRLEFQKICSLFGRDRLRLITRLYMSILVSSMIEDTHSEEELEIFVETNSDLHKELFRSLDEYRILDPLIDFLTGTLPLGGPIIVSHDDAEQALGLMLGDEHTPRTSIASTSKGQVAYLSTLETLNPVKRCMYQRRLFPGSLQYEGQHYAHIRGNGIPHPTLLEGRWAAAAEYSSDPTTLVELPHGQTQWFITIGDSFLEAYFVPRKELIISLDFRSALRQMEHMNILECPGTACSPMSEYSADMVYCKTVATARSDSMPQTFRVLRVPPGPGNRFVVLAELCDIPEPGRSDAFMDLNEDNIDPYEDSVVVVTRPGCVSCACKAGLDSLKTENTSSARRTQVIVVESM